MLLRSRDVTVGSALHHAISQLRDSIGEPFARICVIAPSAGSASLARRALGEHSPFIRVRFVPLEVALSELGVPALVKEERTPEPPGWLRASLTVLLPALAAQGKLGRYGATLSSPGWISAVESAVHSLEVAGLSPSAIRSAAAPEEVKARLDVLATVLEGVAAERAEQRLFGRGEVYRSATNAAAGEGLPIHREAGLVVLGDRMLSPLAFEATRAWLSARPAVRLVLPPLDNLSPAPRGIREAAEALPVVSVEVTGERAVDHLRRSLYVESSRAAEDPRDKTVRLVRNLDERREVDEAVREVLQAMEEGVPLDRIAVVLPEGSESDLLIDALDAAGVPSSRLVGPPLIRTGPARLLLHVLSVARGDESAVAWYQLLRHPELGLRRQLGPNSVRGRGRWRRILADVADRSGTVALLERLQAAKEVAEEARKPAIAALARSIEALWEPTCEMRVPAPLCQHARRWSSFVRSFIRRGPERGVLVDLLDSLAGTGGSALTVGQANDVLKELLRGQSHLVGELDERSVRVLPPMELVGGSFDRIFVLGVADGRLPRRPKEDELLTDATIEKLAEATGVQLADSKVRADWERRRFAAIVSAAAGPLWLSQPACELMNGRPVGPGQPLLDTLSALTGQPATYGELERWMETPATDGVGVPAAPERALSAAEYLIARAAAREPQVVEILAAHPIARRLLQLCRSLDRFRQGQESGQPFIDAWTGRVDPSILASTLPSGEPAALGRIQRAVERPHQHLFQDVLGAWRPPRLSSSYDVTEPRWVRDRLRSVLREADSFQACSSSWSQSGARASQRTTNCHRRFGRSRPASVAACWRPCANS